MTKPESIFVVQWSTVASVPERTRPLLDESYVAPQTPLEQFLTDAWRDVLQVDRIGVHDNFFELGGHSLLLMRMLAGVREFPTRVKCASLAWHTMKAAVSGAEDGPVSTE